MHASQRLHMVGPGKSIVCRTQIEELNLRGMIVELYLDAHMDYDEQGLTSFDDCVSPSELPCGLAPIYLLHAHHRRLQSTRLDFFIVLQRISPTSGKPNCFRRIGLMTLDHGEVSGAKSWQEHVRGRIEPIQEDFWLF
jgi:hypothetical protein